ncbi:type IV toxin-antitoxin system AbiEi family antitoxin domain-containing protein [Actinomycetospora termitidis]|uniref:Type IV toxin-antitoxin system AbiEi family antitoxin domain-containing protein n=1 Tax=Actinomycetospora termitidis TaxID=3053470 RepID=A0ABT7M8M3_9PSEU|nr:type IV toxin-antitoxin system AbiEi family antitoxin domain-containing protein [Actinomycetospora sp. Odt1-22]MDL5157028.1 type IV toxin-antitoxin system AbiEi family antitoxin domain-containing protein [Actinomycetospora sp. Odt1-22]
MRTSQVGAAALRAQMRDQDGVATVEQAKQAGYTRAAIAGKIRRGEWERPAHGVLRTTDHPLTPRARIRIAMLSLGADATLVGRSAAYWWRMVDVAPTEVEIAVAQRNQPRPRPGVTVVRRAVPAGDRVAVDGLFVTKRAATVLAAVAALGLIAGAKLMDRVLQKGLVTLDALQEVHGRSRRRYGAAVCTALLALAAGGARSEAERMAHRALRRAGITGWVADHRVVLPRHGPALLDLAFVDRRILVEVDGWAYHRDLRAFLHDSDRQNALVLAGWVVIRTNWHELKERPEKFVLTVREALAERARP